MLLAECDIDQAISAWEIGLKPVRTPRTLEAFADSLSLEIESQQIVPLTLTPAQRAFCRAWDRGYQTLVMLGSVQSGKTFGTMVVPTLYQIVEDGRPVILAGPTDELAKSVWRGKGDVTLRASGYGSLLPQDGAGSRTGVPDEFLTGHGCRVYFRGSGGANQSQQASTTARAVLITEVDSIALSKKTSKNATQSPGRRIVDLFDRRRHRYGDDGRLVLESTLKLDRDSLIVALWQSGTCGVLMHPCPHCGAWTQREWQHVSYDDTNDQTASASVRIACPSCGVQLSQIEYAYAAQRALVVYRGQHINAGVVVGPDPTEATWSLRYSALDDPATSLAGLAVRHRAASLALRDRQEVAPMSQFWLDYLAAPYTGDGAETANTRYAPEALSIAMRSASSTYDVGSHPFAGGSPVLSFAIDQQERELWWMAYAELHGRGAIISADVEYICGRHDTPTPEQRRSALDRCKSKAESLGITARNCGVDAGGRGYSDVLTDFLRSTGWQWWALRGDGRETRGEGSGVDRLPGWYEVFRRDDGRNLLLVESPTIKDGMLVGLSAPADNGVAILLPRGVAADSHLAKHLTAESKIDGKWVQVRARNDLFDTLTYCRALAKRSVSQPSTDFAFYTGSSV